MKVIKNRKIKKIKSRITLGIMRDYCSHIISYQEITGNYSPCNWYLQKHQLYHTKK